MEQELIIRLCHGVRHELAKSTSLLRMGPLRSATLPSGQENAIHLGGDERFVTLRVENARRDGIPDNTAHKRLLAVERSAMA